MVLFNYSTKELTAKVVYYGPGLCGKTTNLQWIHEKLPIKNKGKMISLATETDRTLFFDFLPIEIGTIRGMRTRIQLYTVPGQVFYNATRRMVLKGADAVVFVCDSQEATFEANLESYTNMRQNLEANEIDPDELPLVMQYNKRDLPNALPIEILNERLNQRGFPFYEAVAVDGRGVEETLKAVTKLVFKSLSARYGDGGAQAIRGATGSRPSVAPVLHSEPAVPPSKSPIQEVPAARLPLPPRIDASGELPPLSLEPPAALREPLAERRAPRPEVPTRPPTPPTPPPPPSFSHPPERTLVSSRDEADELRQRIAAPNIAQDEDLDLEELDEESAEEAPPLPLGSAPPLPVAPPERAMPWPSPPLRSPTPEPRVPPAWVPPQPPQREPAPPPSWTPSEVRLSTPEPEPLARHTPAPRLPESEPSLDAPTEAIAEDFETSIELEASESEVEVPIELEVTPGTTRLTIRLKLMVTFKQ